MCGYTLPYDTVDEITLRLQDISPHLVMLDDVQSANFYNLAYKLIKVSYVSKIIDYGFNYNSYV